MLMAHTVLTEQNALTSSVVGPYRILYAREGVFIEAHRKNVFYARFPLALYKRPLAELAPLLTVFDWNLPKIPSALLIKVVVLCLELTKEIIVHFDYNQGVWNYSVPLQEQNYGSCTCLDGSDNTAMVQLHSHHGLLIGGKFSNTDDKAQDGLAIYVVIGFITGLPTVSVRVGVFGHFLTLSYTEIFESVLGVQDYKPNEVAHV